MKNKLKLIMAIALAGTVVTGIAHAKGKGDCPVSHADLEAALKASVNTANGTAPTTNGGFDLDMWATVVDRDGIVCAVVRTGPDRGDQWPGSRVISAQKANTANAFGLPGLAISTANLFSAVQPGGSLFGLQESNPVDTDVAYGGNSLLLGKPSDPMTGKKIGGVNVFGGGLALYNDSNEIVGAVGVSGDTSCADHNIAWRVRDTLGLDYVPGGPGNLFGMTVGDNMIFDITGGTSASGFGHPACGGPQGDANDANDNADVIALCPLNDGTTSGCAGI